MKKISLIIIILLIPVISIGQEFEKEKIKSVVKTFFEGFHKKDSLLLSSVLEKSFHLNSTSFKENEGILRNINGSNFISAVISRPDSPSWKEKLFSYDIKIDGPLANVWVEYEFFIDNKLNH